LDTYRNNAYLYNGKLERSENPARAGEFNDDFGLNWGACPVSYGNYGARFYEAQIACWHSADPLAESYYPISPYAYVANNPIKFIDPDGMRITNSEKKQVLSNQTLIQKLKKFDKAVSRLSGKPINSYNFVITGGDRYLDDNGLVRSATNNLHIEESKSDSKHLQEFGAKALDLRLAEGISYDILKQAADEVGLWITDEGAYDTHFHLHIIGDIEMTYNASDFKPVDADFIDSDKKQSRVRTSRRRSYPNYVTSTGQLNIAQWILWWTTNRKLDELYKAGFPSRGHDRHNNTE